MKVTLFVVLYISLPITFNGCKRQEHAAEPVKKTPPKVSQIQESKVAEANTPSKITEDAADLYYNGWLLSREAEKTDDRHHALQKFQESLDCFQTVKTKFPEWKSKMVDDRVIMTTQRITVLKQTK